jgi:TATA-binding protein-associated factor Taf7
MDQELSPVQGNELVSPVSYKEDPAYLSLKQDDQNLVKEISNVNKRILDTQQQLKVAVNMIQQSRFQKKIDEFNALLKDKESKLKQVQADIARRES